MQDQHDAYRSSGTEHAEPPLGVDEIFGLLSGVEPFRLGQLDSLLDWVETRRTDRG